MYAVDGHICNYCMKWVFLICFLAKVIEFFSKKYFKA